MGSDIIFKRLGPVLQLLMLQKVGVYQIILLLYSQVVVQVTDDLYYVITLMNSVVILDQEG